MDFVDRLRSEHIAVSPSWSSFGDTIRGLTDLLVATGAVAAERAGTTVQAVIARETEASTALLEIGVAVPHARLHDLAAPAVAVGISARGLYEPVPTVPMRIVVLAVSPVSATEEHLHLLARAATLLRSAELRAALLRAADPSAALSVLRAHARAGR